MKEIITTKLGDLRFVASGKNLHFGQGWKVFPDFLSAYLAGRLNPKWGEPQLQQPIEQQHPINQWYTLLALQQENTERTNEGLVPCNSGAALAWFRLAYDLYLIEHNAELQSRLVKKLRDPTRFQGARFEVAVAAMMLAAGYEIEFSDEKGPGKHPEFFATHTTTGVRLAVEAKSRHRPGIHGFKPESEPEFDGRFDISNLLQLAVNKDTAEPLVVFIDLNAPTEMSRRIYPAAYSELNSSWQEVQKLEWPNGFPAVAVVFYNDISPWYLDQKVDSGGAPLWVMALWPDPTRGNHDSKELIQSLVHGCANRAEIPHEFPGSG